MQHGAATGSIRRTFWSIVAFLTSLTLAVGSSGTHGSATVCADSTCSGHGHCLEDGICECFDGWAGAACDLFIAEQPATQHSQAIEQAAAVPAPSPLAAAVPGTATAQGAPSPYGLDAQTVVDEQAGADASGEGCPEFCSGHGQCNAGLCECSGGWTGVDCATAARCPEDCNSPSGRCVGGMCVCSPGFGGVACAQRVCLHDCWGHGQCTAGRCYCNAGWAGEECEQRVSIDSPRSVVPATLVNFNAVATSVATTARSKASGVPSPQTVPATTQSTQTTAPVISLAVHNISETAGHNRIATSTDQRVALYTGNTTVRKISQIAEDANATQTQVSAPARRLRIASSADLVQQKRPPIVMLQDDASSHAVSAEAEMAQRQPPAQTFVLAGRRSGPSIIHGMPPLGPGQCIEDCSGHGDCLTGDNGNVCLCKDGWSGEACDVQPCPHDCNGRGTCMFGECLCSEHFYGLACEYGRCPDDCNGQGFCHEGQCLCNQGFAGMNCSEVHVEPQSTLMRDPVPPPPPVETAPEEEEGATAKPCPNDCNGNGYCTVGVCACHDGFSGDACQDFCPNNCNGKGKCTGGRCLCLVGFIGNGCEQQVCCNGRGDCTVPDTCVCSPGWMGDQCETEIPCPACGPQGVCKFGVCECAPGWSGETCEEWPPECGGPCPTGGECDRAAGVCLCGGAPCNSTVLTAGPGPAPAPAAASLVTKLRGTLRAYPVADAGQIEAPTEHTRSTSALLVKSHRVVALARQGTRVGAAPQAAFMPRAPNCNVPHGIWNDTFQMCVCEGLWHGALCEHKHCPDWGGPTSTAPECSGHGTCLLGECQCITGFGMAGNSSGNYTGPNICADAVCPIDCGPHGQCVDGTCVCQEGWQGPACREPQCPNDCSGHGMCSFTAPHSPGECTCEYGYALPDCQLPTLFAQLPSCPNECSGNGLCMGGVCVCAGQFTGVDCGTEMCPPGGSGPGCDLVSCPRDCYGHGLCFEGQCTCDEEHMGPDCSIPRKCYGECSEICLHDLESEACETCKGRCLTLVDSQVLGHHTARLDRLSTFATSAVVRARPLTKMANHTKVTRLKKAASLARVATASGRNKRKIHRKPRRHGHHVEVSAVRVDGQKVEKRARAA